MSTGLCTLWIERVARGLCSLEGRHPGGGDGNGPASAGIAPRANRAGHCSELSEAGDGDGLALGKRVRNGGGQSTELDGETLDWKKRDTFVVPSWRRHRHVADEEAVLFSFSDRPVQEKLDLWREERG